MKGFLHKTIPNVQKHDVVTLEYLKLYTSTERQQKTDIDVIIKYLKLSLTENAVTSSKYIAEDVTAFPSDADN